MSVRLDAEALQQPVGFSPLERGGVPGFERETSSVGYVPQGSVAVVRKRTPHEILGALSKHAIFLPREAATMMRFLLFASLVFLLGCGDRSTRVQQGDGAQVSIIHLHNAPYAEIQSAASSHCAKFGRNAVLLGRFSDIESVFRCV